MSAASTAPVLGAPLEYGRLSAVPPLIEATGSGTGLERVNLLVLFVVGLLAGAHCLGMCGPLVTTYADRIGAASDKRRDDTLTGYEVRQHALFNLGRTASYAAIGGLFGLLGAVTIASSEAVAAVGDGVRGVTGILVGIAIIASGLYYVRGRTAVPGHDLPVVGALFRRLSGLLSSRVDRLATSPGIVALGAVHGLMPCPIIYPAYLYAFSLGSPTRGALSLAVLGLGTIPTLFAYGTVMTTIGAETRVRLHRGLGAAFIVLGYIPLSHGLMLYGIHLPHLPLPYTPLF
ncbi:sulfite exporter TauE/SafE family protein [Natrinema sp. H-ect4]|uniref:sulfite exporter TauE/SafE family protein n=1 Tax=Natrinema sp. H-ect4 TaxID=3242699 RepID=UPI0035A9518F